MKLAELEARFWSEPGRHGMGVTFDCPLCVRAGFESRGIVSVAFANPIDGGAPAADYANPGCVPVKRLRWQRTGTTLEDLTLAPSLDCSHGLHVDCVGRGGKHAGWHGHVQNGHAVGGGA